MYETEPLHRLAKVFGGAVSKEHRGAHLLEKCMQFGVDHLIKKVGIIDVIYATTRTVTPVPQVTTKKLGYKMLGIFPNVRRTDSFETHALAAYFNKNILSERFTDFKLHPKIRELYEIVKHECKLDALETATEDEYKITTVFSEEIPTLEIITDAPEFVKYRFEELGRQGQLPVHFFPFHVPNALILSPDLKIEVFLFISKIDRYCTIIDIKKQTDYNFTQILNKISKILREINVRYIEIIARTNKVKTINNILLSNFIPCAYFPAFQLHESKRYDYIILSKTYEILDFQNINLEGSNKLFLKQYFSSWSKINLDPILRRDE